MVLNLDSPPISPKTTRDGKRIYQPQQEQEKEQASNYNDLSLEELSPDNVGYDADVEVVRPDHVEEPDSESEDDPPALSAIKYLLWPDTDDELARKMKKLSWHRPKQPRRGERGITGSLFAPNVGTSASTSTGTEALPQQNLYSTVNTYGKRSEIDIEMVDGSELWSPATKRRKWRDDRATTASTASTGDSSKAQFMDPNPYLDITYPAAVIAQPEAASQFMTSTEVRQSRLPVAAADRSNEMDLD